MKLIVFVCLFLLTFSCGKKTATTDPSGAPAGEPAESVSEDQVTLSPEQVRTADIRTGRVSYRELSQTLTVNGRVVAGPQNRVTVSPLQAGFVRQIALLPGQAVRKGQLLARIESPDLIQQQQDYAENRARLTYLEADYARQQELSRENVGALKVFQQTASELNATRARLGALAQRIRRVGLSPEGSVKGQFNTAYSLTSPVNGVVTEVPANLGQFVQPGDIIAQLVGTEGLYAELTVFEKDLYRLQEGQRARIRLSGSQGPEQLARVYLINRQIDSDRSARVLARFEDGASRQPRRPNAFLQATLELGNRRLPALPEGAIVASEGRDYIFLQLPGQQGTFVYKAVPVGRGITQQGYSEVTLPPGFSPATTPVVVQGAYALLSQLKGAGEDE